MADEVASAVNDSAVQDTATTESAPAEEQQLEVVTEGPELNPNDFQDTEDQAEDVADDTAEPEAVEETETPQEDTKVDPKNEWDQLTGPAQERFRQKVNEANELRAQLSQLDARKAQVAQEQELLNEINPETGDYYSPADAERIARNNYLESQRQSLAQERQQMEVQQSVQSIASEAGQVAEEFPIFREFNADGTKNQDFKPEVAQDLDNLLSENLLYQIEDGRVFTAKVLADNGIDPSTKNLVGAYNSPYLLAKSLANAYQAASVTAKIEGQKATEKMLAQADTPTGAKPTKASSKDEANMSPDDYAKSKGLDVVW